MYKTEKLKTEEGSYIDSRTIRSTNKHTKQASKLTSKLFAMSNTYTPGVYNPPIDSLYAEVMVPEWISDSLMYRVIGKEGIAFKAITHVSGCEYVWWNNEKKVIEVWGYNHEGLASAWIRLRQRMQVIKDNDDSLRLSKLEEEARESLSKLKLVFGTFDDELITVAQKMI